MISKGNHVKIARFVWLAVGEEAKQRPGLQVNVYCSDIPLFVQCIIKQLLDFGKGYLTSTLIILDITKTLLELFTNGFNTC